MIENLTKEQEAALDKYAQEGIKIGLATGPDMDESEVERITNQLRTENELETATTFLVYDSPFAAMKAHEGLSTGNALFGQHDISWLMNNLFFKVELGITGLDKIMPLLELAKRIGWFWISDDTTIVTRRPESISLKRAKTSDGNSIQILHNYNDMALKYKDGTGVCVINGTRIPSEFYHLVTMDAESMDIEEIMQIKNTEIRTEFLKKVGIERAFDKVGKQLLDTKDMEVGGKYELFSVELGNTTRVYLRGECPSNQEPFFEAVPPDSSTVEQALNFRNGFGKLDLYSPPLALT